MLYLPSALSMAQNRSPPSPNPPSGSLAAVADGASRPLGCNS
nr:MAG TPA: hypothetical protein [Caudoviricetes sp.]